MTHDSTAPMPGTTARREIASILAAGYLRLVRERADEARMAAGISDVSGPEKGPKKRRDSP